MTGHGAPVLVGDGPPTCSTYLGLERPVTIPFDTNLYYRHLGVRTDATRREIREAYQARRGHDSPRLTYIVKQLLDPQVRARYDATPLGSLFYDDEVEGWLRAARVQHSSELRRQGRVVEAEALEQEPIEPVLDTEDADGHSEGSPEMQPRAWPWAFYQWGSRCQDRERLQRWQSMVATALWSRGECIQLAVGFSGDMASPAGAAVVGYRIVAFLRDDQVPNEALADAVASRVVNNIREPHGAPSTEIKKSWLDLRSARAQTLPKRLPRAGAATSPAPSSSSWTTARSPSSAS